MSSGKFWSGLLPAGAFQDTGIVPAGKVRSVTINMTNYGESDAVCSVYISSSATPSEDELIESNIVVPAINGLFARSGEVVGAQERVILKTNVPSVAARISGFEEDE